MPWQCATLVVQALHKTCPRKLWGGEHQTRAGKHAAGHPLSGTEVMFAADRVYQVHDKRHAYAPRMQARVPSLPRFLPGSSCSNCYWRILTLLSFKWVESDEDIRRDCVLSLESAWFYSSCESSLWPDIATRYIDEDKRVHLFYIQSYCPTNTWRLWHLQIYLPAVKSLQIRLHAVVAWE